jgi:hypothetical protein
MAQSRKFLQPINLLNSPTDPPTGETGDFYYNTESSKIKFYDGTQWNFITSTFFVLGENPPDSPEEGQGWFDNTAGEFYVYDGEYWQQVTSVVSTAGFSVGSSVPEIQEIGSGWFNNSEGSFYIYDGEYWQQVTSVVSTYVGFDIGPVPPDSPEEGGGWFNNEDGSFYIFDGSFWQQVNSVMQISALGTDLNVNYYGIQNVDYIDFDYTTSTADQQGRLVWNTDDETLNLGLAGGSVLQIGQENHVRVKNETGSQIDNGTFVYITGSESGGHGHITVAPFIADGTIDALKALGVVTQDILNNEEGYVTTFGQVRGIDTSSFTQGQPVYVSPISAGLLVETQPISPNQTVVVGTVVISDPLDGSIFVSTRNFPTANLVTYDNDSSNLISSNVQGAIDELSITKADVNSLSSSLTVYPTSVESDVSGYYKMVQSISDPDYDSVAVDISTGNLNGTGTNHLIASLISDAGIFVGSPGSINVTTVGNIAKTLGNINAYSEFFFRMYKRDSGGTETLIGTSSATGAVNPEDLDIYYQFLSSGNFLIGGFSETDRVVIKYYSNILDDGSQSYSFQFGGDQPVRTLIPVPVSVVASRDASGIILDTSNFNGVLSSSDTTVQHAIDTLDDLDVLPDQTGNYGKFLSTDGTTASWQNVVQGSGGGSVSTDVAISNSWWLGV